MKRRLQLLLTLAAVLVLGGVAQAQRMDMPPVWAVGTWSGHSDYRHSDVDLEVRDDGRIMLTWRVGSNRNTQRGWFRSGRLDMDGETYLIRQDRQDLVLTKDNDRRDAVTLRRVGDRTDRRPPERGREQLTLESPKNRDRVRAGQVTFWGYTNDSSVTLTITHDRDQVLNTNARVSGGRYEFRVNLRPGTYLAVIRGRILEARALITVGGMGKTLIDTPEANANYPSGVVTISGNSEADQVEVEIYRDRDRVFLETTPVRNGRFMSRPSLGWGTYQLTVRAKEDGKILWTDKRTFTVGGGGPTPSSGELQVNRPRNGDRFRGQNVEFQGTAAGMDVRIQIYRGRDRVVNELFGTRNGEFRRSFRLDPGRYDATITSEIRGRVLTQRRVSFEVTR